MSETRGRSELQGLFGALLGGLLASFVASAVFAGLLGDDGSLGTNDMLSVVLVGLACAIAFMVGGLYVTDRLTWLGSAMFFASGFTTLWSVGLSFAAQPRWAVPTALGVAIVVGMTIGGRRFGRESGQTPSGRGWPPFRSCEDSSWSRLAQAPMRSHRWS